jgi:branched-chain amino acid transport system substrate-binding protein
MIQFSIFSPNYANFLFMKTSTLCLAILSLLFIVNSQAEDRIKIGISTALTGNAASYGIDLKNSLLFANEKIAQNRYELIFEDDKCNGKDAVAVAHRFVDVLKLKYAAGFACSGTVLATARTYEKAGVIAMTMSASAADISQAGDFIFRTWPSDAGAARKLFYEIAANHKRLGVLSEQTDYAQGFLKSLQESNADKKIEIFNESYLTENTDFRSLILKLKQKNIDSLFINSQTEVTFLSALKQVKELGLAAQIYSAYWAGSSNFLGNAKDLSEGIVYVDLPAVKEAASLEGIKLFEEFQAKFGRMNGIELMFATAFEGFRALHQAIQSGQDTRKYLYTTRFHGLFGEWSFDQNGDIQGLEFVIKVVRQGKGIKL